MTKFYYGGQAVIEGVMMRGRTHMAVAVRAADGSIIVHDEALPAAMNRWARVPLVRGGALLWESLALGMRSLRFSAAVAAAGETAAAGGAATAPPDAAARAALMNEAGVGVKAAMASSLLFGVGLFFVLPLLLVGWADRWIEAAWISNALEGAIRLGLLLGYLLLMGRIPEIARVFGYHGAEHKSINAYEAGLPLTPAAVQGCPIINPRCGTTFLLIVVVLSTLVFVLLGHPPLILRLLSRIVLVPLVAAVAYEGIRWAADHYGTPLVRAVLAPGLALQRLTTRPPSDDMVAVGCAALARVLERDGVLLPARVAVAQEMGTGVVQPLPVG